MAREEPAIGGQKGEPFLPTETVGQQDAVQTGAQPKHTLVPLLVIPVDTACAEVSCGYSGLHLHGHFCDGRLPLPGRHEWVL